MNTPTRQPFDLGSLLSQSQESDDCASMTKHNLGAHLSWLLSKGTTSVPSVSTSTRPRESDARLIDKAELEGDDALYEWDLLAGAAPKSENGLSLSAKAERASQATVKVEIPRIGSSRASTPGMARRELQPQSGRVSQLRDDVVKKKRSPSSSPGRPPIPEHGTASSLRSHLCMCYLRTQLPVFL
jgi:bloom syndrome protein